MEDPHLQLLGCKDGAKAHPRAGCQGEPPLSQGPEHRLLGPRPLQAPPTLSNPTCPFSPLATAMLSLSHSP